MILIGVLAFRYHISFHNYLIITYYPVCISVYLCYMYVYVYGFLCLCMHVYAYTCMFMGLCLPMHANAQVMGWPQVYSSVIICSSFWDWLYQWNWSFVIMARPTSPQDLLFHLCSMLLSLTLAWVWDLNSAPYVHTISGFHTDPSPWAILCILLYRQRN